MPRQPALQSQVLSGDSREGKTSIIIMLSWGFRWRRNRPAALAQPEAEGGEEERAGCELQSYGGMRRRQERLQRTRDHQQRDGPGDEPHRFASGHGQRVFASQHSRKQQPRSEPEPSAAGDED